MHTFFIADTFAFGGPSARFFTRSSPRGGLFGSFG